MMCRAVHLRDDVEQERILRLFCDEYKEGRYSLHVGHERGQLVYASDWRFMCRTVIHGSLVLGEEIRSPHFGDTWAEAWPYDCDSWVPLAELSGVELLCCVDGYGTCPQCECESRECSWCAGCGEDFQGPSIAPILGVYVDGWRLRRIAMTGGDVAVARSKLKEPSLAFKGGVFEGLCMGMDNVEQFRKQGGALCDSL